MKILSNRYQLLEVVGNGGMSVVYKAEDLKTNTLVAIKVLKEEFLEDEDVIKRFHMESEAIGKLDDKHVVKVLDVGVDDDDNYIVMELLKPDTLQDLIKKNKRFFENAEIINMALQILRGIQAAHQNEIIHRDIKPQNILIDENGVLKVSDFGIARVATRNTLKNTKDAMGSVHYASPEQSRGSLVDKRTDIYSFGILLYELATNRLPFQGDTAISIALKHSRSDVVNPSYINLNLNPSIEAIILKAMQKEPCHRFQSVGEMIELLEELEKDPGLDLTKDERLFIDNSTDTIDMAAVQPFLKGEAAKEQKNRVEVTEGDGKVSIVPMAIAAVSAVLIAAIILLFIFWTPFRDAESAKPFKLENLVNMSFSEASDLMSKKNVKLEKTDAVHNAEIGKNKIISQIPEAGAVIKDGATVKVVVSLGKNEVTVPELKDMTLDEAKVKAGNEGLKLKVEKEFSDKKQGLIIKQQPAAGEKLESGDAITVTISLGKESSTVMMPSLIGKTSDEALKIIKDSKLIIGLVESEHSDTIVEGLVCFQSVNAGSDIAEGTMVNLKLSLGPKTKQESNNTVDEKSTETKTEEGTEEGTGTVEEPSGDVTTFYLPLKQDKETYQVKVIKVTEAGEEIVYDNEHQASEGSVRIDVVGKEKMTLKFLIDNVVIDEKEVVNE